MRAWGLGRGLGCMLGCGLGGEMGEVRTWRDKGGEGRGRKMGWDGI